MYKFFWFQTAPALWLSTLQNVSRMDASLKSKISSLFSEMSRVDAQTVSSADNLLEAIWDAVDDGDGLLFQDEFTRALECLNIEADDSKRIFACVDIDQNGKISKDEFKLWWLNGHMTLNGDCNSLSRWSRRANVTSDNVVKTRKLSFRNRWLRKMNLKTTSTHPDLNCANPTVSRVGDLEYRYVVCLAPRDLGYSRVQHITR